MGGTHELSLALQMTLTADFRLGLPVCERSSFADLGELITIGRLLHQRMTVNACHTATGVWTRLPIGLNAALMAAETGFILTLRWLAGILTERDETPNPSAAAGGNVVASRAVAILARSFFRFVARVKKKNFPHLSLGKFFKLCGVASLANFVTDVSGRA
jgi:hypothetical protein